jgi:hypothetical protein
MYIFLTDDGLEVDRHNRAALQLEVNGRAVDGGAGDSARSQQTWWGDGE